MAYKNVKLDLKPLKRFRSSITRGYSTPGGSGGARRTFKQWAARWRAWSKERFVNLSRGGSDRGTTWAKLKPKSQARRRNKNKNTIAILRDTGTLLSGLSTTFKPSKGAVEKPVAFGITVGFGGPATHPKGKATIALIASAHHFGGGGLPARTIVVKPPRDVMTLMARDAERNLGAEWRKATA